MKKVMTFILIVLASCVRSQVVLDHAAISAFSCTIHGEGMITSTAGQVETNTITGATTIITQGFQQPQALQELIVSIEFKKNNCTGLYDAKVTSMTGCQPNETVTYYWNNVQGSAEQKGLPENVSVNIITSGGCQYNSFFDLTKMELAVIPCDLVFHNFISPNGDGDNDIWKIDNIELARNSPNKVSIYNRWGNLIWETTNYDNDKNVWRGTTKSGDAVPDGTYFYNAKVAGQDYQGYIEVSR